MINLVDCRALILAGGQGERLRPLTDSCPKPLLPILGKPLIWYVIDPIRGAGLSKITIAVRYMGERIVEELGNAYDYLREGTTMADNVFLTAKTFSDPVIFGFSADTLITRKSIERLIEIHDVERFDASLLLTTLPEPQQKKWNFIIKDGVLQQIKVESTFTTYERVGLALNRSALVKITNGFTEYLAKESDNYPEYNKYQTGWNFILKRMIDCGLTVQAELMNHPVYNVNTHQSYNNAENFVKQFLLEK
jgi:NDP-sugar pyrophosphorylase family protein